MKKLVIFDLDGTIINTLIDLKNSLNQALFLHNYPERTLEQTRKAIGNGVYKLIERSLPHPVSEEEHLSLLEDFRKHYLVHASDNTLPYDGVFNLLVKLREDGYLLAVCTNKLQEAAEQLVNKMYPNLFDIIVGDQEGLRKKPEPDMVKLVLKKLGIQKSEAIYIGDSEVDKQTAVNSEIDYIVETYGYRTNEEWYQMDPNQRTVATPEEVYLEIKKY